ncbi:MAG: site-specific DNA-methyltransferase [Gemmataceae bacterium]|nr:site-specific DNA-methyltransferase [Gemmataceae bacterium]
MRWRSRTKRIEAESPGLFSTEEPSVNGAHSAESNGTAHSLDELPELDRATLAKCGQSFERDGCKIQLGDAASFYDSWPSPTMISVDGPYGVGGFDGDTYSPEELADWYEPHIAAWSKHATPLTTLWFWNTEIGWANVHPVLARHGWSYRGASVWDKGVAHIAGNVNTGVLRKLPIVTELCVHYVKDPVFTIDGRNAPMKEWLRHEWVRSGLPLYLTNEACGVKNAATRKYFTQCRLWYYPPVEVFEKFVAYANERGDEKGRPYFSLDGKKPLTGAEWERMRAKFQCEHGVTNVWQEPAVRGQERIKEGLKAIHTNQKPLRLVELTVRLCTDPGDVVWEPFGGLCTTAIACHRLKRQCFSAEVNKDFFRLAVSRLARYDRYAMSS